MSRKMKSVILIAGFAALFSTGALAKDQSTPDWPCVQRKVADLSASQVWDGPEIELESAKWRDDDAVSALVPILASRRVPIEQIEPKIKKFAEGIAADKRDAAMTLLFTGLFDTVSAERRTVVAGIEKFNRRQKELSATLENKGKELSELEAKAATDEKAAADLASAQEHYDWDTRIFKERQDNFPLACEIPTLIDERLFAIAKMIRAQMKS